VQAAEKAIETIIEMNRSMNIPLNIKELGVSLDVLPKLVEDSMRSGNVSVNPRLTKASDIQLIIEKAYEGDFEGFNNGNRSASSAKSSETAIVNV
jgi:alcohol dehydrogenase class IV